MRHYKPPPQKLWDKWSQNVGGIEVYERGEREVLKDNFSETDAAALEVS